MTRPRRERQKPRPFVWVADPLWHHMRREYAGIGQYDAIYQSLKENA